jgi:hypothetical protein
MVARAILLVLCCLGLAGCASVKGGLVRVWDLPNSHTRAQEAERADQAQQAEDARASAAAAKPVQKECKARVVYKHHFSERVVVEAAQRNASAATIGQLQAQIRRLGSDLAQAEKALITAESSLTGVHTRAQAVRALAEARNEIDEARVRAPWRRDQVDAASRKLDEADRQLRAGHIGASILFASRALRIADGLNDEARAVRTGKKAKQIGARPVRLRSTASAKGKLVEVLPPRMPVFPEEVHGKWVLVRTLSGKVGWLPATALQALPASPAPGY